MNNTNKSFGVPLILVVIVIILGGIYLYSTRNTAEPKLGEVQNIVNTNVNVGTSPNLKTYTNQKYSFSIQYPSTKYADDNKYKENGIYLHPLSKTRHFYPENVRSIFTAYDAECSRFVGFKKPDGQTITVGSVVFQHASGITREPMNTLIDIYEVYDKYFYTKEGRCYSASLGTHTAISRLDTSDPQRNKILSDLEMQKKWAEADAEIEVFRSDFKQMVRTFKIQ